AGATSADHLVLGAHHDLVVGRGLNVWIHGNGVLVEAAPHLVRIVGSALYVQVGLVSAAAGRLIRVRRIADGARAGRRQEAIARERSVGDVERNAFIVASVAGEDFRPSLVREVVDQADSRRPLLGQRNGDTPVAALHRLQIPAHAGVEGDEILDAPTVLDERADAR